ncbi:MAG: hypothetical protein DID91_2727702402 [Candidatus Nitrotoga sp. MKT]|nr:MAG: hypothetical protein DID91_2727702402 [Candidatus Nitrotoga sp. MKT]
MMQMAQMQPIDVLRRATSKVGRYLNIPLLGKLQPDAPADIIAVNGNSIYFSKIMKF